MQKQVDAIRKLIDDANVVDESLSAKDAKMVCSGGVASLGLEPPALYLDQHVAVQEWENAVWRTLNGPCRIRWVEPPKLELYIITMQDKRGTQRVVSNRYTVLSKLACVEVQEEERENGDEIEGREVPAGADRVAGSL